MSLQNTKNPDFQFFLGDKAKDLITGYEGIIICRSQYLTNCNTYGLKSIELKDGVPRDTEWFDEPHIVLIEEKVHEAHQSTGGPTDTPKATNREL
jgi:hypothetical protein